jgi:AraC-like DNA-binding protein
LAPCYQKVETANSESLPILVTSAVPLRILTALLLRNAISKQEAIQCAYRFPITSLLYKCFFRLMVNHFNDTSDPFTLSRLSHCLNFFNQYECRNLLDRNARQNDVTIRLNKSFYTDLIANQLASSEDRLAAMILHQQPFNTINQHIPADPAVLGILKNILDCPFKGDMKSAFIREHVRALLMLQLFHFSPIVTGKKIHHESSISKRDEDVLQEVKKYIDEHFLDATSIEKLSKYFGINEFKLKHGFKVLFDTSPIRYLQYKRLAYSRCLLRDTDKTIKQIADEIGYSHGANFTVAFTKVFGNSPLHYRSKGSEIYAMSEE